MFSYCAPNAFEKLGVPAEVLKDSGYTFMEVLRVLNSHFVWESHCDLYNKSEKTVVASLPKTGSFLIIENDHAFCIIDGVNHNNIELRNKRVEFIYEIKGKKS